MSQKTKKTLFKHNTFLIKFSFFFNSGSTLIYIFFCSEWINKIWSLWNVLGYAHMSYRGAMRRVINAVRSSVSDWTPLRRLLAGRALALTTNFAATSDDLSVNLFTHHTRQAPENLKHRQKQTTASLQVKPHGIQGDVTTGGRCQTSDQTTPFHLRAHYGIPSTVPMKASFKPPARRIYSGTIVFHVVSTEFDGIPTTSALSSTNYNVSNHTNYVTCNG